MEEKDTRKQLLTRWEIIFLLIAVLIILYFVLHQFGINVTEVTDETEVIQRPHH